MLTGIPRLDPGLAARPGVYMLWSGMRTISASVGGLMDAAPEPTVVQRVRELVAEHAVGALEAHDLRMRHAGRLPSSNSTWWCRGHDGRRGARHLRPHRGGAEAGDGSSLITIHVEPEGKAKQHGVPVV